MRHLPDDFPADLLTAIELRKLDYFYEQFVIRRWEQYGSGHFILACYAALPAVLTPDLLYKLWLNFKTYSVGEETHTIHAVAPMDLLLSPLVEEIGFELYEMPENTRKAFLLYVRSMTTSGVSHFHRLFSLDDIAAFLHDYAQYDLNPGNPDEDAFREAQLWTAMSYLEPANAFARVAKAFQEAKTNPERMRYRNAIEKMTARFALDIIKEGRPIPRGFRAMTALTSVVRDLVQGRDPKELEVFRKQALEVAGMLTEEPVLQDNVVNIEIPAEVTARLRGREDGIGGKRRVLRALVVGVGKSHHEASLHPNININDAELFAGVLADPGQEDLQEIVVLRGQIATKSGILKAWQEIVEASGEKDDLVFYLSARAELIEGHCKVYCADSPPDTPTLLDVEIRDISVHVAAASVTIIVQTDHAASPYWIDRNNDKFVLFAALATGQSAEDYAFKKTYDEHHFFTYILSDIVLKKGKNISNRQLLLEILRQFRLEFNPEQPFRIPLIQEKPFLICESAAYNRLFLQGINYRSSLQSSLRSMGYYDGPNNGLWDTTTATAFARYQAEFFPENYAFITETKATHTSNLGFLIRTKPAKQGICLLIVRDPGPGYRLDSAINPIGELVRTSSNMLLFLLANPTREELIRFMKDPDKRNRIRIVYYSGFDKNGDFNLADGAFTVSDFGELLDYQDDIRLLFSNTSYSRDFAWYLASLGIGSAIGSEGMVEESYSVDLGINVFQNIFNDVELNRIPELSDLNQPLSAREAPFEPINKFILFQNFTHPDKIKPLIEKKTEYKDFREKVQELYMERIMIDHEDIQSHLWGGRSESNGKRLKAIVVPHSAKGFFQVTLLVEVTNSDGEVAFFVDSNFPEEIIFSRVFNNEAKIELIAYESFTAGVYTEDGTMLELNLGAQEGYPNEFYRREVSAEFRRVCTDLDKSRTIVDPKDKQRGRWGRYSISNGKSLSASVEYTPTHGIYSVTLFVRHVAGYAGISGDLAFFLPATFTEPIRFKKAWEEQSILRVNASKAFTVGVYMMDGTMLELDLGLKNGYPVGFYPGGGTIDLFYTEVEIRRIVSEAIPGGESEAIPGGESEAIPGGESEAIPSGESEIRTLVLYITPNQKTWIAATRNEIFILRDIPGDGPRRGVIRSRFAPDGLLPVKFDTSENKVRVKFDATLDWWFYSPELFPTQKSMRDRLGELVSW